MKRKTLVTLLVAAIVATGGAAYLAQRNMQQLEKIVGAPSRQVAQTTTPPTTAQPATPARQTRAPVAAGPSDQKPAPAALSVKTLTIDTSKDLAEACLTFSAALLPDAKYQDYVKISPDAKLAFRVAGERLCLGGLLYGQDYEVQLKAGFPAAGDLKLAADEPVQVSLGERPPLVAFSGAGIVLPRESTIGVPITTLNVEKVSVRVYRISDRLVARMSRDRLQNSELYLYQLKQLADDEGALVWRGEMAIPKKPNEKSVTAFPLRDVVKPWVPGVYFVAAWNAAQGNPDLQSNEDSPGYYDFRASGQWIIDSDTGLTTFQGSDGMQVFARSLQTAQPMAGITMTLIARNNEELARATTDAQGRVTFAPGLFRGTGGNTPVAVMSYGTDKKDFNYLDLQRGAFDLSDRGVDGRATPGPVDAYLYTDRGIYRPGETVNVVTMLRDRTVNAISDVPVTLVVKRPDGVEASRHTLIGQNAGTVALTLPLSASARRGMWTVAAYVDPTGNPVGQVQFSVEDFVPQRLKVTLDSPQKLLRPGDEVKVNVESRFLYGAPAADLAGEASIKVMPDPAPYPQFAGFHFGLVDEKFREVTIPLDIDNTDADGKTIASGKIETPDAKESEDEKVKPTKMADTSLPLKATLTVAIYEPGGRTTSDSIQMPVRTKPIAIGIRPVFSDGTAPYNGEAPFEIIVVDEQGQRVARAGLEYTVLREEWNYNWYRGDGGRWRWENYYRDVPLAHGTIDALAERPVSLRQPITWGRYRVEVRDAKSGAASSYRFYAGWREQTSEAETPDTVTVTADKASYAIGDTAHIRIEAPFAGEALIVFANDRIFDTRSVTVPADGITIDVPVSADWGAGAYALVTAYRPLAQKSAERSPVRAIGVAWMSIDQSSRTLAVPIGTPDRILPRQKIEVPIKVTGTGGMKDVMVTLAAVDEGILQLTKFVSPAPDKYYFAKRRLTVAMRDDYGQLLDGSADGVGAIRTGGDSAGGRGLDVVPVKIVSLFSGIVRLESDGTGKIPLDIPDFTGELRLMAVAFDATRVGKGEGRLTVRDPVVSDMTFPRFLAPGDEGRASLLLHNVEGKPGNYKVTLKTSGAVAFAKPVEQSINLPEGKRLLLNWPLLGTEIGIGKVTLNIEGPGGFSVSREWQIQVRPAQAETTVEVSSNFAPNGELVVDKELLNQFVPGSADVSVTVSRVGGIDVASLLRSLDRYPYGCLEQTTSRAFPLLFFTDLALLGKVADDKNIKTRVQNAIGRILDMQSAEGSFGMWSGGGHPADDWLQVFAIDFLMQARDQKYFVPESAVKRGLSWMRNTIGQFTPDSAAYAYYVLARAGLADVGQLRYFQDTQLDKTYGPLARGQIGAALYLSGEKARANQAFNGSREFVARPASWTPGWQYYGSDLRDTAAMVVFSLQGGQQNLVPELVARLRKDQRLLGRYDTSTQEKTWMLMAAFELMKNGGPLKLTVDGKSEQGLKDPAVFSPDAATVARRFAIRNDSDGALWSTVAVRGVPKDILGPEEKGLTVERKFFTLDGKTPDLTKLRQNDRLIVSITGRARGNEYHEAALVDLLPAGFEIEGMIPYVSKDDNAKSTYPFLPAQTKTRMKEGRDDRFFATFTLGDKNWPNGFKPWWYYAWEDADQNTGEYSVAYIVRATTPGTYILPAARIEDMYHAEFYARTRTGKVVISARE